MDKGTSLASLTPLTDPHSLSSNCGVDDLDAYIVEESATMVLLVTTPNLEQIASDRSLKMLQASPTVIGWNRRWPTVAHTEAYHQAVLIALLEGKLTR